MSDPLNQWSVVWTNRDPHLWWGYSKWKGPEGAYRWGRDYAEGVLASLRENQIPIRNAELELRPAPLDYAIVGSRGLALLHEEIEAALQVFDRPVGKIITGDASGTDASVRAWAAKRGHRLQVYCAGSADVALFPPRSSVEKVSDWDEDGKKAGPIRNTSVVRAADAVIIFRSGKSKGSTDVLKKARSKGKLYALIQDGQIEEGQLGEVVQKTLI